MVSIHPVTYTHLRAHETSLHLVCRLLLEKTYVFPALVLTLAKPNTTPLTDTLFFQAEDGIRDVERSRGLGDVYKRQELQCKAIIALLNVRGDVISWERVPQEIKKHLTP